MRYCNMIILGKIVIVAIFIISGVALGKAIIESEEDD